jgi:hypothetical protein
MEKEIGRIKKNETTDIIVRVDEYKGKKGLTIREFVTSETYTGFTKAGVRVSPEDFINFREMINSIDYNEFMAVSPAAEKPKKEKKPVQKKIEVKPAISGSDDSSEINEEDFAKA